MEKSSWILPGGYWALDMDGVIWKGDQPIIGSQAAIDLLIQAGIKPIYVTNNGSFPPEKFIEKLQRLGFDAKPGDVVAVSEVTAHVVQSAKRVLTLSWSGVNEMLDRRGVNFCPTSEATEKEIDSFDAVVVSNKSDLTGRELNLAVKAILNGAKFFGTNIDPLYPGPDGFGYGGGAVIAAVSYATGVWPTLIGKPTKTMCDYLIDTYKTAPLLMVGDQLETDGFLAGNLGIPFALVETGVSFSPRKTDGPFNPDQLADTKGIDVEAHRFKNLKAVVDHALECNN